MTYLAAQLYKTNYTRLLQRNFNKDLQSFINTNEAHVVVTCSGENSLRYNPLIDSVNKNIILTSVVIWCFIIW